MPARKSFCTLVIVSASVSASGESGNPLCWTNDDLSFERCCHPLPSATTDCWSTSWYSEEFCCHPLPPGYDACYNDIRLRATTKLEFLYTLERSVGEWQAAGLHEEQIFHQCRHYAQMANLQEVVQHAMVYEQVLADPPTLWHWACSSPNFPLLWSEGCACCDPPDIRCTEEAMENTKVVVHEGYRQCCLPIFTRQSTDLPDERLMAVIRGHLAGRRVRRVDVVERGPKLWWKMEQVGSDIDIARGCLISVRNGKVTSCDDDHGCPKMNSKPFDCSYVWAFLLMLEVVQSVRGLPDLDLVLNPGDVSMDAYDSLPVFTRTGTRWTNTIALPFEWQLHPAQCRKQIGESMRASELFPWQKRMPKLIWRGSSSNCRITRCQMAPAAVDKASMEACGRLPVGEVRDCTWNFTTWLQMPRGRLVWLSHFFPDIDAKLVLNEHLQHYMDPGLEDFLRSEGLIEEPMPAVKQARYKYAIAVEGDSAPDRVYWQLFTGSVLLIPDGPWQVLALHDLLEPFVHFVPVRYDLSDLPERIMWLRQHDDQAERIAQNGMAFARRYLTCEALAHFVDTLLREYVLALD